MTDAVLIFDLNPPDLYPDRCLNARHRQAGCTLCVDHCPVGAIQLLAAAKPLPVLDSGACIRCGVCINVCPTDAFSQALHPEARLLNLRDEFPADEGFALTCPQHPTPARSAAPVRYAIGHQRCLAAFAPEQLLNLSQDGGRALWLEDGPCGTCPIGQLHEDIEQIVDAANRLLIGFGRPPAIHLSTRDAASDIHEIRVLDGGAPAVSRRGFFRSLGKLAQQRADEAVERLPKPLLSPGAPVDQRLPYQTPPSLLRLNQHLTDLARVASPAPDFVLDTEGLPWADVRVDESICSGCQLCARFCPTGALNYLWGEMDDGVVFNLNFHPTLCLDCNICVAVCPEDAVNLEQRVSLGDLLKSGRALLMAGYLDPCERCGALTRRRSEDEQTLCFVCRAPTMYRQHTQRSYLAGLARQLLDDATDESTPSDPLDAKH